MMLFYVCYIWNVWVRLAVPYHAVDLRSSLKRLMRNFGLEILVLFMIGCVMQPINNASFGNPRAES